MNLFIRKKSQHGEMFEFAMADKNADTFNFNLCCVIILVLLSLLPFFSHTGRAKLFKLKFILKLLKKFSCPDSHTFEEEERMKMY